jgi:hypothetical protein
MLTKVNAGSAQILGAQRKVEGRFRLWLASRSQSNLARWAAR